MDYQVEWEYGRIIKLIKRIIPATRVNKKYQELNSWFSTLKYKCDNLYAIVLQPLDDFCGNAGNDGAGGDIFGYYRAGSHDGAFSYAYSRKNGCVRANPNLVADMHRLGIHIPARIWIHSVVQGGNHHVLTNQHIIADGNAPLVLKLAAGIDKHPLAEHKIFTAVGIERRKKPKGFIYLSAREFRHNLNNFFGRVVAAVEPECNAYRFLAEAVHDLMNGRTGGNRFARIHAVNKFLIRHCL